jgi:hypothetical protein
LAECAGEIERALQAAMWASVARHRSAPRWTKTAAPLLRKALADQDVEVRLRAAKSAIRLRTRLLSNRSSRGSAIRTCACGSRRASSFVVPSPRAIVALGACSAVSDASVRLSAATRWARAELGAVGLLRAWTTRRRTFGQKSAQALARLKRRRLLRSRSSEDWATTRPRCGARWPARSAAWRSAGGSALILTCATTPPRFAWGARRSGGSGARAVVAIAPLLDDRGSPEVRVAALAALGRIASEPAIRTLIKSLASRTRRQRARRFATRTR